MSRHVFDLGSRCDVTSTQIMRRFAKTRVRIPTRRDPVLNGLPSCCVVIAVYTRVTGMATLFSAEIFREHVLPLRIEFRKKKKKTFFVRLYDVLGI